MIVGGPGTHVPPWMPARNITTERNGVGICVRRGGKHYGAYQGGKESIVHVGMSARGSAVLCRMGVILVTVTGGPIGSPCSQLLETHQTMQWLRPERCLCQTQQRNLCVSIDENALFWQSNHQAGLLNDQQRCHPRSEVRRSLRPVDTGVEDSPLPIEAFARGRSTRLGSVERSRRRASRKLPT